MSKVKVFESLSTTYVNLAALLRELREQKFRGSIHVVLNHYEAEVLLKGDNPPIVSEVNSETRAATGSEGAMERLLVHARERGGRITVYEHRPQPNAATRTDDNLSAGLAAFGPQITNRIADEPPADWDELLRAGSELISAVERALDVGEPDFATQLRSVRVELGDDYDFLDPSAHHLRYDKGALTLSKRPSPSALVTGLSECLRRVVNKAAMGRDGKHLRERVAVELAVAARKSDNGLAAFTPHLDRIAGARVL